MKLFVMLNLAAVAAEAAGFAARARRYAAALGAVAAVLRGLFARTLVRHAFVWLSFVTVLHMRNDFGFDGFFRLRRHVLRIGSDGQQDGQGSEAFFHRIAPICVSVLLLPPKRSEAGCIVGAHPADPSWLLNGVTRFCRLFAHKKALCRRTGLAMKKRLYHGRKSTVARIFCSLFETSTVISQSPPIIGRKPSACGY